LPMTLGELKAEVMSTVGADYTADIVRYLNKGLLELSAKSQVITRADVSVVEGSFAIPDNCLVVKDVFHEGAPLVRYPQRDLPEDATGTPLYWFRDGNNIKLYPRPNGTVSARLAYVKKETTMEAEEDTHTLEHADDFLIAFAKWKVLIDTRGVSEEAMYWKNESQEEMEKWRKLNFAQHQRPRKVRAGRWY